MPTESKPSQRGTGTPADGTIRVAAVQMVSTPAVERNLIEARRLIGEAVARGARLVALPEYFGIMGMRERDKVAAREAPGKGPIQDFLAATARELKVWLVGGSVPLECSAPEKVRNSCLVYDDEGKLVARYDKIHLFSFETEKERYAEDRTIEPGGEVVTVDSPCGRLGLSICYDLRFPELYRSMGEVDLILVPSSFTATTGRAHWETLLRARAIENLCYVLAPAQGGKHENGRETNGDTMAVDPWGIVLERIPSGPGVVVADMDLARMAKVRRSLPALTHRTLHRC
ncbi:MAG: carbon-nitrogen hydrolase family protein [Betaproteobacteria bacterium]|nr:carbon-nitrogen hydrolase family protein [Betaproteobacteria bacterium]